MKKIFKNKELIPSIDNPFESDTLERQDEIINLTKLLIRLDSPFTLAVNGSWGSGKTSFIRMWEAFLKSKKYITINYNAWENDSSEFPLLTFMGEIQDQIIDKNPENKVKIAGKELLNSATTVLSKGIESSLASITGGVVHFNLKETIDDIKESLENAPTEYVEYKKRRKKFKQKLENFAIQATDKLDNKTIICFIDELDRCKPTFAVELLENIKHYLCVNNYIFVIALDKKQLGISIGSLYGSQMDTEGYLKRFIDITYNLKTKDTRQFTVNIFQIIFNEPFIIRDRKQDDRNLFFDTLEIFTRGFKLSLREIEQLIFHLRIINKTLDYKSIFDLYLIPILLILRNKRYDLYSGYFNKTIKYSIVIEYIEESIEWNTLFKSQYISRTRSSIYNYLELIQLSSEQLELKIDYYKNKIKEELDQNDISNEDYEQYLSIAQQIKTKQLIPFKDLYEKIESFSNLEV